MNDDLYKIRHTLAHILAAAVKQKYPQAKLAIGPVIDNGFYYDIDFGDVTVGRSDLGALQLVMAKILKSKPSITRREQAIDEALVLAKGDTYKEELIRDLKADGETTVSFYKIGDFEDLCKGPHLESVAEIKPDTYKLLKVAGAYWRGNERNKMLTRIYGLAFATAAELADYLAMLAEAEKRDHKKLGKDLDLFAFSDLIGAGLPLWTPKGALVRNLLDDFVWELRRACGYEKVEIPHITKKELYERSGHWDKFKDELFRITTREGHEFAMKPMNCPHHTQLYARKQWSYRDLPQRYANTTACYRDEQTGELYGLSRVRSFAQDDAHVFCRPAQIKAEFLNIWEIVFKFYQTFGFELSLRLSLSDPAHSEKYLGDPQVWRQTENILREIIAEKKADFYEGIGEAAFYGPKLDFMAKDAIGRQWQVATIQLDMNMPERFDLFCINEQNDKERIIMIHAAIMGSLERFMSILIEHTAGVLPVWLAPVQIKLLAVGEKHHDYCLALAREFNQAGLRAEADNNDETVGNKTRKAIGDKIPYILVIGDQEMSADKLTVRDRGGRDTRTIAKADFIVEVLDKVGDRSDF